nr:ribonuclease Y-like [Setaria viridis]
MAAAEEAVVTEAGTSARGVPAEVAPAAEAEVPAPEAPTGAEEPASAVAMEGEVATGILAPPPAPEAVAMSGEPAVASSGGPTAAPTGVGARAPGLSASLAASGMMEPISTVASGSAPASASDTPVPKVWRGSVLHWSSRDDPPRHLFTLDDAAEWRKWQAVQGGLANARTALSSVFGELDSVVLPGCQVATAQQVINDLQRREQAAQEDARRAEAKFQAVVDKARLDREEVQATTAERARLDAKELAQLKGDLDALHKTVERIRRERQKAWQERDFEAARKGKAETMAAELGMEVDEMARLREVLDAERAEHGTLRDAVRVVCDGLGVV